MTGILQDLDDLNGTVVNYYCRDEVAFSCNSLWGSYTRAMYERHMLPYEGMETGLTDCLWYVPGTMTFDD